jgi:hypothetical protein
MNVHGLLHVTGLYNKSNCEKYGASTKISNHVSFGQDRSWSLKLLFPALGMYVHKPFLQQTRYLVQLKPQPSNSDGTLTTLKPSSHLSSHVIVQFNSHLVLLYFYL